MWLALDLEHSSRWLIQPLPVLDSGLDSWNIKRQESGRKSIIMPLGDHDRVYHVLDEGPRPCEAHADA